MKLKIKQEMPRPGDRKFFVVMAYMAMTEDGTELELKCADFGRNEKLMPLNSDQASWIIFLPMKESSVISSARNTLLRRPS